MHVSVYPPSTVLAVITALPKETPVTTPDASTVATDELLLLHVTVWSAIEGSTVAVRESVPPTTVVTVVGVIVTPVAGVVTVTVQVAVILASSCALAVIVAVPAETPVTTPDADTVATAVALLLHRTFWFVAFAGRIVAVRARVPPTGTVASDGMFTDVTGRITVTVQKAL